MYIKELASVRVASITHVFKLPSDLLSALQMCLFDFPACTEKLCAHGSNTDVQMLPEF